MVERVGIEDIKNGFDMFAVMPYFALFSSVPTKAANRHDAHQLIFSNVEIPGEPWDLLKQNLTALEQQQSNQGYIIRFYNDLGKSGTITPKTEYTGSFLMRMRPLQQYMPAVTGMAGMPQAPGADFLMYLQHQLEEKNNQIADLESENDDLCERLKAAEQSGKAQSQGGIMGILETAAQNNPQLINGIANRLLDMFLPPAVPQGGGGQPFRAAAHTGPINGVPETAPVTDVQDETEEQEPAAEPRIRPEQRINQALKTLVAFYNAQTPPGTPHREHVAVTNLAMDMELLAGLTKDPANFNFLLTYLRGN